MKLNPPASSSDLDAAREIARRLHQRRRSADRAGFERREAPATGPTPAPVQRPAAVAETLPRPLAFSPPAPPVEEPDSSFDTAFAFETPVAVPAPLPVPNLAPPLEDVPTPHEATFELPASIGFDPAPPPEDDPPPSWDDIALPVELTPAAEPLDGVAPELSPDLPAIDAGDVSPDELIGSAQSPAFDEAASPFDEAEDEAEAEDGTAEELFDATSPPSWDEIVETCLALASASAGMIVDPAGQVFAARGNWPDPGPEAIAGRLVAMMERTLRDAPTRSISAPLGGQHLTAWRVPLAEGLVTAAFIGDAPLRADMRLSIDAEIHRGPGA